MTSPPTTESIWLSLSADLRRFIRRRVPDDHAADDLLQETFLRIHRGLGTLQDGDRLAAWVYRIARNVVNDHHRKPAAVTVPLEEFDPPAVAPADCASDGCDHAGWLADMVRSLPDGYRDAVRLGEIDGLAQQDVAERLGLSESGAKSRIQRGRAMLRGLVERCCRLELDHRGAIIGCNPKSDPPLCCDC